MGNRSIDRPYGTSDLGPTGPWVRWWWPGNVLDDRDIEDQLEAYAAAGFRGVEVSPIYAVPGTEGRQVDLLSAEFTERLATTIRVANTLRMGVDLILGSGWPYGGPWVGPGDAARKWVFETRTLEGGATLGDAMRAFEGGTAAPVLALATRPGARVRLGGYLRSTPPGLDWVAPAGDAWTVYLAWMVPTGQTVKRSGPGGAGRVLDPFDREAVARHLARFDRLLRSLPNPGIRCVFHDSWEVHGADATPGAAEGFARRFGRPLEGELDRFMAGGPDASDLRADYRVWMAEAIESSFLAPLRDWSVRHGCRLRNQAHGSPANLLDLYALSDLAETEWFGGGVLRRGGLAPLGGTPSSDDVTAFEEGLVCRMAGSTPIVAGNLAASAEAFTWLGDHGRVPLSHMAFAAARLFTAGVGELVFHGAMANPRATPWPGWRFYASTHIAPSASWWEHLPELNAWVGRCQSVLRHGVGDGDVLLLMPDSDERDEHPGDPLLRPCTVHNTADWLRAGKPGFVAAARALEQAGLDHDFVSETQICTRIRADRDVVHGAKGAWRSVLVPATPALRTSTLEQLHRLAHDGACVLIHGDIPDRAPAGTLSFGELPRRAALLGQWVDRFRETRTGIREAKIGAGRIMVAHDLGELLAEAGFQVVPDAMEATTRRRRAPDGLHAFVHNPGPAPVDCIVLRSAYPQSWRRAVAQDPWTGAQYRVEIEPIGRSAWRVPLRLLPGESWLVRLGGRVTRLPRIPSGNESRAIALPGPWELRPVRGHPDPLPEPATTGLGDWCEIGPAWRVFSGVARYRTLQQRPGPGRWAIDLGTVLHSARVSIDGTVLSTRIAPPYRFELPADLPPRFELTVDVANLDANALAELDRRRTPWKPFFIVGADYRPFDAAGWDPLPSGLIGPVRLIPFE